MSASTKLTPDMLFSAYCQGIFPMADEDGTIYWYDPNPRAILPLDEFHLSRSLQRTLHKGKFEIRFDTQFDAVIRACAAPAPGRQSTWINDEIIAAYNQLHQLGYAHSVESWQDGHLAGGLYGVAIRGLFAGESMFSSRRDASKVALAHLVDHLRERNFVLLDIQFLTAHLVQFGAKEISRYDYHRMLRKALRSYAAF